MPPIPHPKPSLVLVALLSGALALCAAGSVAAQTSDNDLATQHFEQGVELYQEGSLDAALVEFERAYELVRTYRLLFNLAQLQAERHEYVKAIALFEQYLEEGGSEIDAQRYTWVREELRKLRRRVAELWIDSNAEGAQIFVNGTLAGELPLQNRILIDAGICNIRLEKEGYKTEEQTLKVAGGERTRLTIAMQRAETSPTAAVASGYEGAQSRDPEPAAKANMTPFWVSAVTFAVLGSATATLAVLTNRQDDKLSDELQNFVDDEEALDSKRNSVRTLAALTDGFGAATVIAAGFAVYYLVDPPMERANPEEAHVKFVPQLGGAALVGAF